MEPLEVNKPMSVKINVENATGVSSPSLKRRHKMSKKFMEDHSDKIKFVSNFHSSGNSWIYPYNGRKKNDIEKRNPGMLAVF